MFSNIIQYFCKSYQVSVCLIKWQNLNIRFKGTEDVIQSDSQFKECHVRLTTVPLNLFLSQKYEDIVVVLSRRVLNSKKFLLELISKCN